MYRSKATAALIRLKEMDRKYRTNPQTNGQDTTDSSTQVESAPKPENDSCGRGGGGARIIEVRVPRVLEDEENKPGSPGSSRTSGQVTSDIARGPVMAEEFSETTDIPEMSEISRCLGQRTGQRGRPGSWRSAKDSIDLELDEVPGPDPPNKPGENFNGTTTEQDESVNGDIVEEAATRTSGQASTANAETAEYEGDTFEEATTTSGTGNKETSVEERPDARIQANERNLDSRGSGVIELVSPKLIETGSECEIGLDKELSRYVREAERDESRNLGPVCLLKSSQTSSSSGSRRQKRQRKTHGRSEAVQRIEEPGSPSVRQDERPRAPDKDIFGPGRIEVTITKKSMDIKEILDGSSTEERKRRTSKGQQALELPQTGSHPSTGKNETETDKRSTVIDETGSTIIEPSEEEFVVMEDPTRVLRKLNREAIEAVTRGQGNVTTEARSRMADSSLNRCRNERTSRSAAKNSANAEPYGDFPTGQNVGSDWRTRPRRAARSARKHQETTDQGKVTEEAPLRMDPRDLDWIRKRVTCLLLEKEAIRNYLKLQPEAEPVHRDRTTIPRIKPLEFPKIANFQPDENDGDQFETTGMIGPLHDRISVIRRWLRDQYVLYREYSSLARTLNAGYAPATLEEAKQTIRRLRLDTIKTR